MPLTLTPSILFAIAAASFVLQNSTPVMVVPAFSSCIGLLSRVILVTHEFALLLPNMDAHSAISYFENLRLKLLSAMHEHGWPVTFSIGVASYELIPKNFYDALAQADALMYEGKKGGRDRILQRSF